MSPWLCLVMGSILGGFARYWAAGAMLRSVGSSFPFGTLFVNLSGCLLIGFFDVLASEKLRLSANMRMLLMTGFCGAFTTFSTFILETAHLLKDGQSLRATANFLLSCVLGYCLYRVGASFGRWV